MPDATVPHPLTEWLRARFPPPTLGGQLEETAILVPSAAVGSAIRHHLVMTGWSLIGVHLVTAPQFARLIAERCGDAPPTSRPDPLVERAVLTRALRDGTDRYALEFPSALGELLRAVREWQLSGAPEPDDAEPHHPRLHAFHAIATRFAEQTRPYATRHTLFIHAKEAVEQAQTDGSQLTHAPFAQVLIVDPTPARDALILTAQLVRTFGMGADRFVQDAEDPPPLPDSIQRSSHPHIEAELRAAASGCLAARARGIPWHDMVVALPRVGAYASELPRAFQAEGVPFRCEAERPLAFEPRAATAIHAAHVLFGNPTRQNYIALIDAPLSASPFDADELHRFDTLSREFHLRGRGPFVEEFATRHLAAGWKRIAPTPRIAETLKLWSQKNTKPAPDTIVRVARMRAFLNGHLTEPQPGSRDEIAATALEATFEALEDATRIDDPAPTDVAFATELERILRERAVPMEGCSASLNSVQVLEVSDALARPAAHLHIAGLSEEFWPNSTQGTESFLSEADREQLQMTTRPEDRALQRALLSAACHHATASLQITRSRRRASDGRAVSASFWLDELKAAQQAEEIDEATHPLTRAQRRVEAGTCPRDLALLRIALQSQREPAALIEIAGTQATHTYWQNARSLESFEPTSLARDGDLGPDAMAASMSSPMSATRLTDLGYCPQRYFFGRELNLPLLPPEPDPCELPRDRIGIHIHSALEGVYGEFDLAGQDDVLPFRDAIVARALELFEQHLSSDRSPLRRDFPTLHGLIEDRWRIALETALDADLRSMAEDGSRPIASEAKLSDSLTLTSDGYPPITIPVLGYVDRIDALKDGEGIRVVDFKTGRKPDNDVDWKRVIHLKKPQLALYAELLRQGPNAAWTQVGAATIRAVRPPELRATDDDGEDIAFEHELDKFDSFPNGAVWKGFRESLVIGLRLRERGAFVADNSDKNCTWCDFRIACRRLHPPSMERVMRCADPAIADYLAMKSKTLKKPLVHTNPQSEPDA